MNDANVAEHRRKQSNPAAVVSGILGTLASSALLYLGFVVLPDVGVALATEEEDDEIDFEPGALVKLGSQVKAPEIPEKVIIDEADVEDIVEEDTITEEEDLPLEEPEPEPEPEPKDKPPEPPKEKPDPKKKKAKEKRPDLNPFNDPATNKPPPSDQNKGLPSLDKGDPFGDPGGWSDLAKDGDPWATAVMKALNNMPVGSYAAKGKKGNFKFQLTLCKDGSIKKVDKKGGSLDQDGQDAVRLALEQLDLPKPPPAVAKKMKGQCAKIKYKFVWSASGVK